jgi:hypothetical protein
MSFSYVGESGSEWLGVEASKRYLLLLSGLSLGNWVAVEAMKGQFEDLSIDNKL